MREQSRREFLKLSACGVVAAGGARAATAFPAPVPGEISVRVTGAQVRYQGAAPVRWKSGVRSTGPVVVLDPEKKYQEILGFGAAFTDAACYTFNRLDPAAREKLFHELFHPSEMGMSVCRTCIGASDYSTKVYSYDDGD